MYDINFDYVVSVFDSFKIFHDTTMNLQKDIDKNLKNGFYSPNMLQLIDELECGLELYIDKLLQLHEVLELLEEESLKRILKMKYLAFHNFDDIASKLGFSYDYVINLHDIAIEKLVLRLNPYLKDILVF